MRVRDDRVRELKVAAAEMAPEAFVREHVLGGEAYVFRWLAEPYGQFRQGMARLLEVQEADVRLIGSGKLGFSLHEGRLLQAFRPNSDLDLAVVASGLFDATALELRTSAGTLALAGEEERRRLRRSKENVFSGYLRPDQLPLGCSLMREWFPRLAGPYAAEPARSHPVRAWLFKSWDHAQLCYVEHHQRVQEAIRRQLAK